MWTQLIWKLLDNNASVGLISLKVLGASFNKDTAPSLSIVLSKSNIAYMSGGDWDLWLARKPRIAAVRDQQLRFPALVDIRWIVDNIYTIYTIYTIYCRVRDREDDNDDTVTPWLLTPAVIRHRDSDACLQWRISLRNSVTSRGWYLRGRDTGDRRGGDGWLLRAVVSDVLFRASPLHRQHLGRG